MSNQYEHLQIETTGEGVRTITLNRPDKLNAVNIRMSEEVPAALEEASRDDAVRVVVITGAGRGFCAGLELSPANIAAMTDRRKASRHERLDDLHWVGRWVLAVSNCDKPVIAAVNGPAVGAGCGLALSADIRLISEAATVSTGYIRIGLCPDAGVSYFLPRLVGVSRATELIMAGRRRVRRETRRRAAIRAHADQTTAPRFARYRPALTTPSRTQRHSAMLYNPGYDRGHAGLRGEALPEIYRTVMSSKQ